MFILPYLVHEKSANKELAKEYLDLSKPLVFGSSNDSLKAIWFIRASSYHRVLDDIDSAQFFFAKEAYQLSKQIGNKSTIATSAFLHSIFIQNDSLKLEVKRESLQMFLAIKDFRLGTAQCLSIYGYYLKKQNKEKAVEYLTKAQEIGKKTSSIDIKVNLFYALKENSAAEGDFVQAYKYADSLDIVR